MNKNLILKKLDSFKEELDFDKVIILSGASLVLQGVINETHDIDLSCDVDFYNSIDWPIKNGAFNIEIKSKDCFDISYNLYYPNDIVIINGYKCMNLKKCLEIKKGLNRKKDQMIINRLESIIKKQ